MPPVDFFLYVNAKLDGKNKLLELRYFIKTYTIMYQI